MSNLVETKARSIAIADDHLLIEALRSSFYPGAKDDSIKMVLSYCQAGGYDPMTKPVHIVPVWDKNAKTLRDTIMPGIGLYRIIADRTGKYAGQDDAEFGPEIEAWGMRFPQWCKVTIYKITSAGRVPYSAKVFWLESYATAGRDSEAPNAMWKKRPYGQLEKCAEAAVLRKAFPEVGAQPTAEEMMGRELEIETGASVDTASPAPSSSLSRTEQAKSRLLAQQHRAKIAESLITAGAMPPPDVDMETGEIREPDPLTTLIDAIRDCQSKEEMEQYRGDVAVLKGDEKRLAVTAWKAQEAVLAPVEAA